MSLVFKTPKSTLNTTSKAIQNLGGDCPPCPEPVVESTSEEFIRNGEYTLTPKEGVDGFSQVDITVNIPSDVNNQNKTVSPSTSSQTVEADSGYSGLGTVTVNPVTSSIDNNISAGNIKKDVTILGVTGNYDPQPNLSNLNITPSTNAQEYNPAISGVDGYNLVSVAAVTAAIDSNIQSANILSGVTILGVAGSDEGYAAGYAAGETDGEAVGYAAGEAAGEIAGAAAQKALLTSTTITQNGTTTREDGWNSVTVNVQPNLQSKTITPTTAIAGYTPDQGYDGFNYVQVNGVTSAIDNNIQAGNIKSGVTILGVQGTYDPQPSSYAGEFVPNAVGVIQEQPDQTQGDYFSSVTIECTPDVFGSAMYPYGPDTIDAYDAETYTEGMWVYFQMGVDSGTMSGKYYVAEDSNGNELSISKYMDDGQGGLTFPTNFDLQGRTILVKFEPRNATVTIDDSDPNEDPIYTISILGCQLIAVDGSLNRDDWFNSFTVDCFENQLIGGLTVGYHYPGENQCGLDAYYFTYVNIPSSPAGSFLAPFDVASSESVQEVNTVDFEDAYIAMDVITGQLDPSTGFWDAEDAQGNIFHIRPYEDNPDFDPNEPEDPQTNPLYIFPQDFNVVNYTIQCLVDKKDITFNEDDSDPNEVVWTMEAEVAIEGINYNADRESWATAYQWGAM